MTAPMDARPIAVLVHEFYTTLQGLRQLGDVVAPHAADLGGNSISLDLGLNEEKSKDFADLLKSVSTENRGDKPMSPEELDEFVEGTKEVFAGNPDGMRTLGLGLSKAAATPHHQELLYRALLTMGIASLEVLVAGLVTHRLQIHPGALNSRDVRLTLAELEDFANLSEAREYAISREVDRLMFKGLAGWESWLTENADVVVSDLSSNYDRLFEAFQRRHVIVHNGARASRIYRARLKARGMDAPDLDATLDVTPQYLFESLNELALVGVSLAIRSWRKWEPSEVPLIENELSRYVVEEAKAERWAITQSFALLGLGIGGRESAKCQFKLDKLLATRELDGREAVDKELREWDTSALDQSIHLGIAAIRDDFDKFFSLLDGIDRSRLPSADWLDGPLFQHLRSDPRWPNPGSKERVAVSKTKPSDDVPDDSPESSS